MLLCPREEALRKRDLESVATTQSPQRAQANVDSELPRSGGARSRGDCVQLQQSASRQPQLLFATAFQEVIREVVREVFRQELPLLIKDAAAGRGSMQYLAAGEAAKVADVAADTIRTWVRKGMLKGYYAGRVLRVRRDELEAFLARKGGQAAVSDAAIDMRAASLLRHGGKRNG